MEFTVSKAELVRELNLSQGVVEKKTTIPILSNVLLEAAGDRVVLDGHGSGAGHPLHLPGSGAEGGCRHHSGKTAAGLCAAAAGCPTCM